jgi:hypothetical protein
MEEEEKGTYQSTISNFREFPKYIEERRKLEKELRKIWNQKDKKIKEIENLFSNGEHISGQTNQDHLNTLPYYRYDNLAWVIPDKKNRWMYDLTTSSLLKTQYDNRILDLINEINELNCKNEDLHHRLQKLEEKTGKRETASGKELDKLIKLIKEEGDQL